MGAKKGDALVAKLEAVHMLAVEAEAFQSAVDDVYHRGLWSAEQGPDHRRDLNHMECFLEAAHAAGIVHRDLKPDNVWLQQVGNEPRPIVKILDFGLSKLVQHRRTEHTATNVMFGTAAYMSPEQCRSSRDVGPPTDVYALGCLSYELLCGQLPFAYDNMAELVAAHQGEDPPRPLSLNASIDPTLDALLAAMVAKDPVQRPTLSRVRSVIASARPLPRTPARPRPPTSAAQPRPPQPNSRPRAAPAGRASTVLVHEKYGSRRRFVLLVGLVVLGAVIVAAVASRGGASQAKPGVIEESRSAIELDASVAPTASAAPSVVLDASVPLAMPAPRVDASTVAGRSNVYPDPPPVARDLLDGGAQESEPTVVAEPNPAMDTTSLDAGVEPDDEVIIEPGPSSDAAVEVDVAVTPAKTSPSSHRTAPTPTAKKPTNRDATPPVPAAKKPPKRNMISNPFKKKEITK